MKCKHAKILISAALDGELSEREQAILYRHLRKCESCMREKEELAGIKQVMRIWMDEEPSEYLSYSFSHKLQDVKRKKKVKIHRRPIWIYRTVTAGAIGLILAAALLLHNHFQTPDNTYIAKQPKISVQVEAPETPAVNPEEETLLSTASEEEVQVAQIEPETLERRSSAAPSTTSTRNESEASTNVLAANKPAGTTRTNKEQPIPEPSEDMKAALALIQKIIKAKGSEEEATTLVAQNLSEAGVTVDESVELVRGALRKAADVLAAETDINAENNPTNPPGGMIL